MSSLQLTYSSAEQRKAVKAGIDMDRDIKLLFLSDSTILPEGTPYFNRKKIDQGIPAISQIIHYAVFTKAKN
jgi:hypothetical protein